MSDPVTFESKKSTTDTDGLGGMDLFVPLATN